MGFDRYEKKPSSFDLYYDAFLQNSMQGRTFRIQLQDGSSAEVVPTTGSLINANDLEATEFSFKLNGLLYRVPFRDLKSATPL